MRTAPMTSFHSLIVSATKTIRTRRSVLRLLALIALVSVAAIALGSTTSSANLFSSAVAIFSKTPEAKASAVNSTLHSEETVEPEAVAPTTTMSVERRGHTATRLNDGRVLIAGGESSSGILNESEIYDPSTSEFSPAGNLNAARTDHTATLLSDGRVLIAGGRNGAGALNTTEIFDPATGTFASGPNMSVARAGQSATLFADGRILFAGGDGNGTAEILDASLGGSTAVGSLGVARSMHSAALLQDGRVLVVGGRDADGNELASGEIFDTPAATFSAVDSTLQVTRVRPLLRVVFDGKVQIIGGNNDGSMEVYDPTIERFGAYAHVLPETDTCTGLKAGILAAQTRWALFHNGQTDDSLDRSGQTITELGNSALVVGGANSAGTILSSTSMLSSNTSSISTDKMDYAPGETAHISGRGFAAGETVRVKIHEDPHTPQERGFDIVAEADGSFSGDYLVMDYDLDMKFIVSARGLSSGATAHTTFTDSKPNTVTVGTQSPNPVIAGSSASYTITVNFNGSGSSCTSPLSVSSVLPTGVTASFSPSSVTSTGGNVTSTLTLTTSTTTPVGTTTFTVLAANGGGTCQSGTASGNGSLSVAAPPTTTTVSAATGTFGGTVNLSAHASFTAGGNIPSGATINFFLNGNPVGSATTTGGSGNANLSGASLGSIAVGTYPTGVTATLVANGSLWASSTGSNTLTVNPACTAPSVTTNPTNQSVTYGSPSVSFTAAASGSPTPTIQWQVSSGGPFTNLANVVPYSGVTTGTLTISNPTVALSGNQYRAVFTNTCGGTQTANSTAATLTVNKANPTVSATGGTFTFDGNPHAGSGSATGAFGESLTVTLSYTGTGSTTYGPTATAPTNAGTYQVVAHTNGDANNNSGDSTPAVLTINKASSATTINCPSNVTYDGSPKTPCTATATGAGSLNVSVTVTYGNNTNAGTATADATFAGDANHNSSTATQVTFTIDKATSSTTITCPTNVTYNGSPQTPCSATATGAGGLNVSVSVTYGNNTNAGTATADATYAGDANHNSSTATQKTFTIDKAASSTTITCPTNVTYNGSPQTPCSATATGAGALSVSVTVTYGNNTNAGTATADATYAGDANHNGSTATQVTFTIDKASSSTTINCPTNVTYNGSPQTPCSATATGAGSLNVSVTVVYANNTNAGTATADATYGGDANHNGSTATQVTFTIDKASSSTTINCPTNVTYNGSPQTPCSATATGAGSLNVSVTVVYANNTNAGTATADATYAGDANHNGSTATQVTFTIDKANSSTTINCPTNVTYDGSPQTPCTATATGAGALNVSVTVVYGNNTNAGTATADATYAGDANHNGSSATQVTFTIDKAASTTTINCPTNVTYDGSPKTPCTATATGAGSLNVSVTVVYGNNTNAGTATADATYAGDANHNGSVATQVTFTIDKASSSTTINCPTNVTYDGSPQTPCSATATGAGSLSVSVTVVYANNTNAGTATADATYAGDANHNGSSATQVTFTIDKAASTTTINCPTNVTYDGSPKTPCTATATGAGGLNVNVTVVYGNNTNAGTATADATYAGDANHNGSTATQVTFTIDKASSSTTINCPTNVTYDGSPQTPCTATATGAGALNVSVTVVYGNNTNAGTATADATYAGDANHNGSVATQVTFTIDKASSSTTINCPTNVTYDGSPQTPCTATATGAGGLNVSVTVVYGNNTNAGTATADATYTGDANHNSSVATQVTFTIDKAGSSTTINCPTNVTYDGSPQTPCSATATGAGGLSVLVSVVYGNNTNAGTATADATYAGDANHNGSAATQVTFTIDKAGSSTTINCPTNVTYNGSPQTPCTATATGAGGLSVGVTVVYGNNTNAGTATADATYAGDANHNGSSAIQVTFTIDKAGSSTTINCPTNVTYDGNPQTPCAATATGVGGLNVSVTVVYGNNTSAGTATADATYTGDANHNGSVATQVMFTIDKAGSSTTINCPTNVTYDGNPQTPCTATATGAGGLNVSVTVVYGDNTNAGTATADATYVGDANHNGSNATQVTFTIDKAGSSTTINCPTNVTYDGNPQTPCTATATGAGGLNVSVTVVYGNNTNAGTATADATFAGDANHNSSVATQVTFTIDKTGSSTTINCPTNVTYDGNPQTPCTATATGAGGLNVSVTVIYGSNTNAGTATANASYAGDANHNGSNATQVSFTIDKRTLTASIANNPTKVYDGNTNATLTQSNFSITNLVSGQGFTVTKTAGTYNSKDVPTANAVSTTLAASDFSPAGGTNPNNYNLPTSASGVGHITAKPLSITADNKSYLFSSPLPTLTATFNAFVAGEGVGNLAGTLTFTLKDGLNNTPAYNASTPAGTYTIIPSGVTSTNYNITFVNGTLTVGAWTITGFYQPVDMNTPTTLIWNTIKGGSTVPLKFNIYAGTPGPLTERKNVSDVMFGTVQMADIPCNSLAGIDSLVDYVTNTGNTALRYDTTGAQFIQNWQTPKQANKCYQVRMTALDGSHIDAFFKTK